MLEYISIQYEISTKCSVCQWQIFLKSLIDCSFIAVCRGPSICLKSVYLYGAEDSGLSNLDFFFKCKGERFSGDCGYVFINDF